MKILILSDSFSSQSYGGAGIVSFDAAKALHDRGHEVVVITTTSTREDVGESTIDGMKVHRLYSSYGGEWRGYVSLYNWQVIGRIRMLLAQIQPDIVQAYNIHTHISYHALKLAKKSGAKVFITMHDVMAFHYGKFSEYIDPTDLSIPTTFNYRINPWHHFLVFRKRYNPLRNLIIRHYLRYANKIFAVSHALKEALNANKIGNVEVIHNGIDLASWNISPSDVDDFKKKFDLVGKKIVSFSGWVNGAKGGDQLLLAMKIVITKIPDAVLFAVGRTDLHYVAMREQIETFGMKDNVIFAGWLAGDELKKSYLASDVVVFPSICLDTFGMVNLEAMAAKKPVVATCFGGAREVVVDGVTGYIVNPYNTADMADKIIYLLEHPDTTRAFGTAGYERAAREFAMNDKTEELLAWYS